MGISVQDANGDGLLDVAVGTFYQDSNTLFVQTPDHMFFDQSRQAGLRELTFNVLTFGTQFLDADLDGWPDLLLANGHVERSYASDKPDLMLPQYFRNVEGKFVELSSRSLGPYFQKSYLGRTIAVIDWNRDGVWAGSWTTAGSFHWSTGTGIVTAVNFCPRDCDAAAWSGEHLGADGPVIDLALDEVGRVWAGATRERRGGLPQRSGIRILGENGWSVVDPSASGLSDANVTALAASGSAMWVGTFDRGATVWRPLAVAATVYLPAMAR